MEIKLIRTERDYGKALERAGEIWDAQPGTPEADELEALLPLIEDYEETHYRIDLPDPIEAIKVRMEELGLDRKDLEVCIGSRGRVSDILNRRRPLTLPMIRKLSEKLGLPGDVLIAPYPLNLPDGEASNKQAVG
ncbi:MAG TPA: helix-turn-helix domain-containing protein [Desulfomonilaceae bacterium]|nr:helix-turn-helix domain-containing protein [Desulfomonilaceae bacterium]